MISAVVNHSVSRFAVIGGMATALYAVVALGLSFGGLRVTLASFAAYLTAALFSYAGHKYFTFVSDGAHRFEAPRFILLTVLGLAVSLILPAVLSGMLGLPAQVPIVATCILIPLVNYVVLRHWVFAGTGTRSDRG